MEEMRNSYNILFRKPEVKRLLGRHRWKESIKMDPKGTGLNSVHWVHLTQDMDKSWALVDTVMNHQVL
jgi:hypothetical protein